MDKAVEAAFRAIWDQKPIRGTTDDARLSLIACAVSAADAARAVTDEEVTSTMDAVLDEIYSGDTNCADLLRAIHAAGFKVMRG